MKAKMDSYITLEEQNLLRGNRRNGCTFYKKQVRDSGLRYHTYGRSRKEAKIGILNKEII